MKELFSLFLEIKKYDNKDSKEQILSRDIQERLDKSLTTYMQELDSQIQFLQSMDVVKILKKINKMK